MSENFTIGQIFEGIYPPEAAAFCNGRGDCFIQEIEPSDEGMRRFQIVKVPDPTLDEVKARKLEELESAFLAWYEDAATMISSLGFECDSDARAMMDVNGLVVASEAQAYAGTPLYFMDAQNVPHEVTTEDLKTIQLEIIAAGQAAYQEKWTLRTAIEGAEDATACEAIEIAFTKQDFTPKESTGADEA